MAFSYNNQKEGGFMENMKCKFKDCGGLLDKDKGFVAKVDNSPRVFYAIPCKDCYGLHSANGNPVFTAMGVDLILRGGKAVERS